MKFPPDLYYPEIDGSHAWIAGAIDGMISAHGGEGPESEQELRTVGGVPFRRYQLAGLVSDPQTEAEINNHRPPSYHIVVTDRYNGAQEMLTNPATGSSRISFDPSKLIAEKEAQFAHQRGRYLESQRNSPNIAVPP